jgi:hypothetical protein
MPYRNIVILNQFFNFVTLKLQEFLTLYYINKMFVYKFLCSLLQWPAVMCLCKALHTKTIGRI